MDIGSRIRYWREKRGFDLRTLSRKTAIPEDVLELIEEGKRLPTEMDISVLSDVLEVDENELLKQIADGVHKADGSIDAGGSYGIDDYYRFRLTGKRPWSVPVLNKAQCGEVLESTDLVYPQGVADRYAWVFTDDPNAFCVISAGESMKGDKDNESIQEGELLLVEPNKDVEIGNTVVCKWGDEGVTVKKYRKENSQIILQPLNPDYEPIVVPPRQEILFFRTRKLESPEG